LYRKNESVKALEVKCERAKGSAQDVGLRRNERVSRRSFDRGSEREAHRNSRVDELHVAVLVLTSELLGGGVEEGVVVAKLEETLDASRRVLGSLSVESVRKRHDESRALEPLLLSRGDELLRLREDVSDARGEGAAAGSRKRERKRT
jgi:hypothetical protein